MLFKRVPSLGVKDDYVSLCQVWWPWSYRSWREEGQGWILRSRRDSGSLCTGLRGSQRKSYQAALGMNYKNIIEDGIVNCDKCVLVGNSLILNYFDHSFCPDCTNIPLYVKGWADLVGPHQGRQAEVESVRSILRGPEPQQDRVQHELSMCSGQQRAPAQHLNGQRGEMRVKPSRCSFSKQFTDCLLTTVTLWVWCEIGSYKWSIKHAVYEQYLACICAESDYRISHKFASYHYSR